MFIRKKLGVDPSEFRLKKRDREVLQIWKEEEEARGVEEDENRPTDTDGILDALRVADQIDVDCSVPSCELCGEEFTDVGHSDADKSVHLVQHFRDHILRVSESGWSGAPTSLELSSPTTASCHDKGRRIY